MQPVAALVDDLISLAALDLASRVTAVALLLVLAAALSRDFLDIATGRLAIVFALGSTAHALTYAIGNPRRRVASGARRTGFRNVTGYFGSLPR